MGRFILLLKSILLTYVFAMDVAFGLDPSCQDLMKLIADKKLKTVDSVLAEISKTSRYQEFLKHYMFIYKSFSVQPASVCEPRAVVYGEHGNMIMTYSSRADAKGRDAIELLCEVEEGAQKKEASSGVKKPHHTMEFIEVVFDGEKVPQYSLLEKNPSRCTLCHGENPRPNFDPYNLWPGTYGSLARDGCSTIRRDRPEFEKYQKFMTECRQTGRYKYLPKEISDTHPAFRDICPKDNDEFEYTVRNAAGSAPSEHFLDRLTRLNRNRVREMIKDTPYYEKYKYVLAALSRYIANYVFQNLDPNMPESERERDRQFETFESCQEIHGEKVESFFPSSLTKMASAYQKDFVQVMTTAQMEFRGRVRPFLKENDYAPLDSPSERRRRATNFLHSLDPFFDEETGHMIPYYMDGSVTAAFKFVLTRMGLDFKRDRLTMGFTTGTYEFTSGGSTQIREIAWMLAPANDSETKTMTCQELRQASIKALSTLPESARLRVAQAASNFQEKLRPAELSLQRQQEMFKILQKRCADCHNGYSAKEMPFDSLENLRASLQRDPKFLEILSDRLLGRNLNGRAQMPPGGFGNTEDAVDLVMYLMSLSGQHSKND